MNNEKITFITLEPSYSLFFSKLLKELTLTASRDGINANIEYLSVDDAYKIYLPGINVLSFWHFYNNFEVENEHLLKEVSKIKHLNNNSICIPTEEENDIFMKYRLFVDIIIKRCPNCIFLMYNDLRWNHAIAIDVLREHNVPYFVFERGVFRPFTTTIDPWGVNASSNLVCNKVKNDISISNHRLGIKRESEPYIKTRFFIFLISSYFFSFVRKRKSVKRYGKKNLLQYILLYFNSILTKFRTSKSTLVENKLDRGYIFVPLQLANDTQTVLHSRFDNTQQFIKEIEKLYSKSDALKKMDLIFKVHPMDCDSYEFAPTSIVTISDTMQLVQNAKVVFTINSTVGFEAFCCGKKVVTFGHSFYTYPPITWPYDELTKESDLIDYINSNGPDTELVSTYRKYILEKYQTSGSVYEYDDQDIKKAADYIYSFYNGLKIRS